jgi:hypothetical protein
MMATKETQERAPAETDVVDAEVVEVEPEEINATVEDAEAMIDAERQQMVVYEERATARAPVSLLPSAVEYEASMAIASRIAGTEFVPVAYRGKPDAVLAAILFGREVGIGPMQALQKVHMIDGKPAMSGDLLLAQMRRGGLVIVASESTRDRAWIHARRSDTGEEAEVEWTMQEADQITTKERGQVIKLSERNTWRSYPADMLWARCVGRLARRIGSDLLQGALGYAAEEVADWEEGSYGTGPGFNATGVPVVATSDGVERRADAPTSRQQMLEQMKGAVGEGHAILWIQQALQHLTGKDTFRALDQQTANDAAIRIGNGIAHLCAAWDGSFPGPTDEDVQKAFAHPDAAGVTLQVPDFTALDAQLEEAAAKRGVGAQDAASAADSAETGDPQSDQEKPVEDAPLGPAEPVTDDDLPDFGDSDTEAQHYGG